MKSFRSVISFVLVCTTLLSCMIFSTGAKSFDDFKDIDTSADYYQAVKWAYDNKYMVGTSGNTFSPEMTLTRAQFATLISNFAGEDLAPYKDKSVFKDVPGGLYYSATSVWAYENGIMNGTGGGNFSPDIVITRQEIAVLIKNYVSYKEIFLEKVTPETRMMDRGSKRAASWAKDAVVYAYKTDYMPLDDKDCFNPTVQVTRGDAAIILYALNNAVQRTTAKNDPIMVTYLDTGSYRAEELKHFDVANIHPAKVTGNDKITVNETYISRINTIRPQALKYNPDLKFVLTLSVNSGQDIERWLYPYYRCDQFVDAVIEVVDKYDFDGVDFDYEFPTGDVPQKNLQYFLVNLRQRLDALKLEKIEEYNITGNADLEKYTKADYHHLVTMAIAGGTWSFKLFDDLAELQHYVDYLNYMDYDLRSEMGMTYNHAATYDGNSPYRMPENGYGSLTYENDPELLKLAASTYADVYWSIYSGLQRSKIVIGAGVYAQRWFNVKGYQLPDGRWCGLYCAGEPDNDNTSYSRLIGMVNYDNILEPIAGYYSYWDEASKSMSLYNPDERGGTFIAFDDLWSLEEKCKMVIDNNIGGLMVFNHQGAADLVLEAEYDENGEYTKKVTIYDKVNEWLAK